MLDLMQIAKTESQGGDLKTLLNNLYSETDVRPTGYPNAIVWKGGKHGQSIILFVIHLQMLMHC